VVLKVNNHTIGFILVRVSKVWIHVVRFLYRTP